MKSKLRKNQSKENQKLIHFPNACTCRINKKTEEFRFTEKEKNIRKFK